MDDAQLSQVIEAAKVGPYHPEFAHRIFHLLGREQAQSLRERGDALEEIIAHQYVGVSHRLDKAHLQESCSYRSADRARQLAAQLIDEDGQLIESALARAISLLRSHAFSLGPARHVDEVRIAHKIQVLTLLETDKEIRRLFLSLGEPFSLPYADELIKETLHLDRGVHVTPAHARRAILAAHLTYLRQNVGSCFATAPASLIHREQPKQFLKDIEELLATGRLSRVFEGEEYSVPLSRSWGVGELMKPVLLTGDVTSLARSPGLQQAFVAAELMEDVLDLRDRVEQCGKILAQVQQMREEELKSPISSAQEIIQRALLLETGLTEGDILDYEARPRGVHPAHGLLIAPPSSVQSGGSGQRVEQFQARLQRAVTAFKRLTDNALLKSWEFTIASFAESKADFARWNFYTSLGLPTDQRGGIGPCIYRVLQERLDRTNAEMDALRAKHDILLGAVRFAENRARQASERELQWMRLEYRRKVAELDALTDEINGLAQRASQLAALPPKLIEHYLHLFPGYFQEVYDADMQDVKASPFDDSPAGFRLLYKHGRTNPSLWSFIHNADDFVRSLTEFFTASERAIVDDVTGEALQSEISDVVTDVVMHVRSEEFLLTALERMARAYNAALPANPLENLDKVDKKPWAYLSGGTMTTLVANYYCRSNEPTLKTRIAESATDLLVFLLDLLKDLPPAVTSAFQEDPSKTMLIQSPTHGFQLKPGHRPFVDGWLSRENTYTWVRDQVIIPQRDAHREIHLSGEMMHHLLREFGEKLPGSLRYSFREAFRPLPRGERSVQGFREYVLDVLSTRGRLRTLSASFAVEEELDGLLYTQLPLVQGRSLREALERLFLSLGDSEYPPERMLEVFDACSGRFGGVELVPASQLQEIAQALVMLSSKQLALPANLSKRIRQQMRHLGLAMPEPLIFADTNWVTDLFAFAVNPGTDELELWRVEEHGLCGFPMTRWRQHLSSQNDKPWCVYVHPYEYTSDL